MRVSKYVTLAEATKSDTAIKNGIKNEPNATELNNMQHVASRIFDVVREHFGVPIAVTSFFRGEALNALVGGSKSSQHCKGEAMDVDADKLGGVSNSEIFNFILNNLEFDQLIWEFGDDYNPDWVHFSLVRFGTNRKQVLRAIKENGKTKYIPYV